MSDVLDLKIRQMHQALSDLSTDDLSKINPEIGSEEGRQYMKVDFNDCSDSTKRANAASLLIANIASIKDHLRVWCSTQKCPFLGEDLINKNQAVALIHDLWNVDKHARLNKPPRSGFTPHLKELSTSLSLTTGTAAGSNVAVTFDRLNGKMNTMSGNGGSATLTLQAQVVDENGKILGDFATICAEAVTEWEKALKAAGVPLPQ